MKEQQTVLLQSSKMNSNGDKQRRGLSLINFYNPGAGTGNCTPEIKNIPTVKVRKPFSSRIWGLRKPKNQQEIAEIKNVTFIPPISQPVVHHDEEKKVLVESRKSVSHVESNAPSVASFLQVKVIAVDMPGFMQAHAFRCARRTYDSLEKFSSKHVAYNMKKEFDRVYGPAWHCIVGANFGSFVTHSTGCFLYFSMEKLYILIFKTKVQRATTLVVD